MAGPEKPQGELWTTGEILGEQALGWLRTATEALLNAQRLLELDGLPWAAGDRLALRVKLRAAIEQASQVGSYLLETHPKP